MKSVSRVGIAKELCGLWLVCILGFCLPVSAYEEKERAGEEATKVVRVFYPLQAGFAQRDENGNYSGYTYEYLMRIAQLTGWKYEFITLKQSTENLQAGLDGVKNGTIDLTCMVQVPGIVEEYVYSAKSAVTAQFTLVALKENTALNSRTVDSYPNLRVALVEKAAQQTKLLDEYCRERGLRYDPVYGKDNAACQDLVKSGKADVTIARMFLCCGTLKRCCPLPASPSILPQERGMKH